MNLDILHAIGACSSLMLRGFIIYEDGGYLTYGDFKTFKEELIKLLKTTRVDDIYHNKYLPHRFSFLVASTNKNNKHLNKWLDDLGFSKTEFVPNSKNKTEAQLHFISIPEIFDRLDIKVK